MITPEKKKTIFILIVLLLVIFSAIFWGIKPIVKKVYQKKDLLEERKLTLEKDKNNFDKYVADLYFIENQLVNIQNLENSKNNKVALIELLEEIAQVENLNLQIESHKNPSSPKKKNNSEIFLKMSLSGDYRNFLKFLYRLENFKYPVQINSLKVESFEDLKTSQNKEEEMNLENIPEIKGEVIISFK
jgi:hypothetical protein